MAKRLITVSKLLWRFSASQITAQLAKVDMANESTQQYDNDSSGAHMYRRYQRVVYICFILLIKLRPILRSKWIVIGAPSSYADEDNIEIYALRKNDIRNYEFDYLQLNNIQTLSQISPADITPDLREWIAAGCPVTPRTDLSLMRRREALGSMVDMENVNEYGALRFAAAIVRNTLAFGFREDADARFIPLDNDWDLPIEERTKSMIEAEVSSATDTRLTFPQVDIGTDSSYGLGDESIEEGNADELHTEAIYIYQRIKSLQAYWRE